MFMDTNDKMTENRSKTPVCATFKKCAMKQCSLLNADHAHLECDEVFEFCFLVENGSIENDFALDSLGMRVGSLVQDGVLD